MKKILCQFMPFMLLLLLLSCSDDIKNNSKLKTRTFDIELSTGGGKLSEEKINTVRFIVFNNASTYRSELDINKRIDVNAADKTATGLKVTLEVSNNKDKMIVAILNEPEAMKATLDAVTDAGELESLSLDFAEILNSDHHTFLSSGNGMPMTGVVWAGETHGFPVSDPSSGVITTVPMTVERAVACVAVYLKAEGEGDQKLALGGKITLENTYDRGYLAVGTEKDETRFQVGPNDFKNFGLMQTVESSKLQEKEWVCLADIAIPEISAEQPDGVLAHYFYTPERTCTADNDADKLVLTVEGVYRNGAPLETKTVVLNKMTLESEVEEREVTAIKRNNIYKIIGTVGDNEIQLTAEVVDWDDCEIEIWDDGAYTLSLSRDVLTVPSRGVADTARVKARSYFTIETNYPGKWVIEDINLENQGFADVVWHMKQNSYNGVWEILNDPEAGITGNAEIFIECGENFPYDTFNYGSFVVRAGRIRIEVQITQTVSIDIGWFAGELTKIQDSDGKTVYKYTKKLYVREDDDNDGELMPWADGGVVSSDYNWNKQLMAGKKNTYTLANHTDILFPAAKRCFESNKDFGQISGLDDENYIWYLPEKAQLVAMWVTHDAIALNPTATLYHIGDSYWSTAPDFGKGPYYVDLYDGYVQMANKLQEETIITWTIVNTVRCIREWQPTGAGR